MDGVAGGARRDDALWGDATSVTETNEILK